MAIVRQLERLNLQRDVEHTEAPCTYSVVRDTSGETFLQIDTYGSGSRKIKGKKSQSIRFTMDAVEQLKHILAREFPSLPQPRTL